MRIKVIWHFDFIILFWDLQRSKAMKKFCDTFMLFWLLAVALKPGQAVSPSSGCGRDIPDTPRPGRDKIVNVIYQDKGLGPIGRNYIIQLPTGLWLLISVFGSMMLQYLSDNCLSDYDSRNTNPVPLVFDLHGFSGNARSQIVSSKGLSPYP